VITEDRPGPDLARSTATMTAVAALSRATGLIRNVVVVGVLGITFLGNTYQTANTVPNVLFELMAAGILQAVLIPTLVDLQAKGEPGEAEHVARSVLGLAGAALAVVAAVGFVAAPCVMRLLLGGVDDEAVREDQIRLGTILLWFFLPQVVLYASNMVATAVLNAKGSFAVPVFAPLLNNVVVTASYGVFAWLRHGEDPTLELSGVEVAVLGLGTTAGVVAFCLVPVIAAVRSGTSLRPRFDWRHPRVRRIAQLGGWAAVFLASTNVLLLVVLGLANEVEGGVVAWSLGYTIFFVPHSLLCLPIIVALYPTLSGQAAAGDDVAYDRTLHSGLRAIVYFVLPASAAMLALGVAVARVLQFGHFRADSVATVAATVAAFGPGLVGFGVFLFLARAFYARGDTRTPAVTNALVVVVASVVMVATFVAVDGHARVAALAAAHSGAYVVGSLVLYGRLRARTTAHAGGDLVRSLLASFSAAAVGAAVMWWIGEAIDGGGRIDAALELALAGGAGVLVYVATAAALGGPRPRQVPSMLRGRHG
jgi:putative peptidoglycan lipid II flippase